MNQEKSSVIVKNSIPSPTDLTQAAVARTQKASAKTSAMTQTLIEKSKALRTPSPAADKIGTTIGGIASVGLLIGGVTQLILGYSLTGLGTVTFGAVALSVSYTHLDVYKRQALNWSISSSAIVSGFSSFHSEISRFSSCSMKRLLYRPV